ncbi:MAG TPA: hypothetical protein VGH79_02255 [Gaiellaceae bacterium]|jgi:hypothetical protein
MIDELPNGPGSPVVCFTSFTFGYLGRARVLADSVKRFHPDWCFVALITDLPPDGFEFDPAHETFDHVVWGHELPIPAVKSWIFKHDLVEVCTAVKGPMLELFVERGIEKIVYLDPDIAVFGSLDGIIEELDEASIVLTPHQLDPDVDEMAIFDNEVGSLQHGTYNLGFVAIRNDEIGQRFATWFADRLRSYCYDELDRGLFVDQKWCDLVPAFFDRVKILRDPGYNVASWNISQRRLSADDNGGIFVNGQPLRFFHFTKLGPIGTVMTDRYAGDNLLVQEIWAWYRRSVQAATPVDLDPTWWQYGRFDNSDPIPTEARRLYRSRVDLRDAFPEPFAVGPGTYHAWFDANASSVSAAASGA